MGVNITPNISPFIVYWFYRSMIPKFHDRMILTRETLSNINNDLLKMPFITSQIASAYFAVVITIAIDNYTQWRVQVVVVVSLNCSNAVMSYFVLNDVTFGKP